MKLRKNKPMLFATGSILVIITLGYASNGVLLADVSGRAAAAQEEVDVELQRKAAEWKKQENRLSPYFTVTVFHRIPYSGHRIPLRIPVTVFSGQKFKIIKPEG